MLCCASRNFALRCVWVSRRVQSRNFASFSDNGVISDVPITKVVLYKHGVGYFERKCTVENNQKVLLGFRNTDMNDMLKTISVHEQVRAGSTSAGLITNIEYDSRLDAKKEMSDISINLTDGGDKTMAGLLPQLKGVSVELQTTDNRTLRGIVMGIETKAVKKEITTVTAEGQQITREETTHRDFVTLLCEQGNPSSTFIQAAELTDVTKLTILDNLINADMTRLLDLFRTSKKNNLKELVIHTKGQGPRDIVASYIVETPVWKAAYKLSLSSSPDKPVRIVGSALVDNVQEEPWDNVQLSLVTGFPVSFKFDLYAPKYRNRPYFVHTDDGTLGTMESPMEYKAFSPPPPQYTAVEGHAFLKKSSSTRHKHAQTDKVKAKSSENALAKTGDFCKWDVKHPVSIRSHGSALVPLLDSNVEGKRIAVYDPKIRKSHPMSAILFKNTSGFQIEEGPAYVDEDGVYVGEVMMQNIQIGEEAIVPYAIDQGCSIKVETDDDLEQPKTHSVLCKKGRLHYFKNNIRTHTYEINNTSNRSIQLFIDHPLESPYLIHFPNDPRVHELTDSLARYKLEIPPNSLSEFVVTECEEKELISGLERHSSGVITVLEEVLETKGVVPTDGGVLDKMTGILEQMNKVTDIVTEKVKVEALLSIANQRIKTVLGKLKDLRHIAPVTPVEDKDTKHLTLVESQDETSLRSKYSVEAMELEDLIKRHETRLAELTVTHDTLTKAIADEAKDMTFPESHPSPIRTKKANALKL